MRKDECTCLASRVKTTRQGYQLDCALQVAWRLMLQMFMQWLFSYLPSFTSGRHKGQRPWRCGHHLPMAAPRAPKLQQPSSLPPPLPATCTSNLACPTLQQGAMHRILYKALANSTFTKGVSHQHQMLHCTNPALHFLLVSLEERECT